MPSKTNEQALESAIQKYLTGFCIDELQKENIAAEDIVPYGGKYRLGIKENFDAKYAIDDQLFWEFLETSQPTELAKVQRNADWKLRILNRYNNIIKKYGVLTILRNGLDVEDAHFTFLYELPLASSSDAVKENFQKNIFSVTRQVHYNIDFPGQSIDMAVFVNGIAVSTIELKNAWTGQTARVNAIKQYKEDRDVKQPLLNFGRCLVHFAVDTDEVYMCTKLAGDKSFFLPFNKGCNNGKGNPINPNGHKSAYLWEEVLSKESLTNIIQHFVRLDGKKSDMLQKRTLFFPRYHQMDVVRKIIDHAANEGVGHTYLIQHSAGSGKSNSITWAAFQLIDTYPAHEHVRKSKGVDYPLFDSVIVVTDRRLLDKQLRDNIKDFSEVKNIVAPAYSSQELKKNLESGKRIIITTIQKFQFIVEGIDDLKEKRFAVIIDEAHSSQSGLAAGKMNQAMGSDDDDNDTQDIVLRAIKARKMKSNASYLAFTATPKNATLERFGSKMEDGSFRPFHLYSMKQAIEEGFIHDVLANYTTYKSYYEIKKSIEENPEFDNAKAQKRLKRYVEAQQDTIASKAEVMLDHFIDSVVRKKKLKGKAKGMVVTQSIESAIRYHQALKKLLNERGNPFKTLIAFSGEKKVDGVDYTEEGINGFAEKDTRNYFDKDDYRLLVVANKYLTGFDQPKLSTMYVDKRLQSVLAVQALSRLNRSANKYDKRTEDLFILDFYNTTDEIQEAFDPFYTATSLSRETNVDVLHDLKAQLDDEGVYEWSEVEHFNERFFANASGEALSPIIDVAAARFNEDLGMENLEKASFKIKAKQFVKIYGQMASLLDYEMVKWEKLFWFLKFLIPKLIVIDKDKEMIDEILNSVDLSTYGLVRTKLNQHIGLTEEEAELEPQNPNPRGSGNDIIRDPLDEIIAAFNDKWFAGFAETPEEARIKMLSRFKNVESHKDFHKKFLENPDAENAQIALKKIIDEVMLKERRQNMEEYKRSKTDNAYYTAMFNLIKQMASTKYSVGV